MFSHHFAGLLLSSLTDRVFFLWFVAALDENPATHARRAGFFLTQTAPNH